MDATRPAHAPETMEWSWGGMLMRGIEDEEEGEWIGYRDRTDIGGPS